jgi:hypothetical protein
VLTPLSHTSITQDDDEVSELKERIMEMQMDFDKRENDMLRTIEKQKQQMSILEKRVKELEVEKD